MSESEISRAVLKQVLEGGPSELARVVIERRAGFAHDALGSWLLGGLGDAELAELVGTAYEVSYRQDEGRYPRFAIFVASRRETRLFETAEVLFDPPIPLHVRALRRLAAAVPPRPHALLLRSTPEGLGIVGIGRFETAGALLPEDQTGLYLRAEGLVLEVNGPGDIAIHEAREVRALRAGRIIRQFDGNRTLGCLELFDRLRDDILVTSGLKPDDGNSRRVAAAVQDVWMYVLKAAVALGHGGTFAILPTEATEAASIPPEIRSGIRFAYPTNAPDLLGRLSAYVQSRWGAGALTRLTTLRSLTDAAFAAARLSATDGFVILNRFLRVLGFGAKIGWDDPIPETCPEVDDLLEPTGDTYDLVHAGTRHSAACRLAQAVPGALVFVISQDAELRLFLFREGIQVTAPLAPITYLFQGM